MNANITDVKIHNWKPNGEKYWEGVKASPTEPLIDASIRMTLSWEQYTALVGICADRDVRAQEGA